MSMLIVEITRMTIHATVRRDLKAMDLSAKISTSVLKILMIVKKMKSAQISMEHTSVFVKSDTKEMALSV